MHTKKLLSIGFITMLVMTIALIAVPVSSQTINVPAQSIWIDPSKPHPSMFNLSKSASFTVDTFLNVTSPTSATGKGLMGWEYKLFWDPGILDLTSRSIHIPAGWEPPQGFLVKDQVGVWSGGPKDGLAYHWYGYTCLNTSRIFTGVMSVCTYDFHVNNVKSATGDQTLDLQEVKCVDDAAVKFITDDPAGPAGTVQDGTYNLAPPPPLYPPTLVVKPATIQGELGKQFNVTIEFADTPYPLDSRWDFFGWEVKLSYNSSNLAALNSFEGPFLPSFAGVNGTYYVNTIYQSAGYVHTCGFFLGTPVTAPYGSGALAIIEFNATDFYTIPPLFPGQPGTFCDLVLYDTKLVMSNSTAIPHTIGTPARYNKPYETLGWALDCYTDDFRKKCTTPFVGKGPMNNADAYEPQDMVILYAELVYNQQPEINKTVTFEVFGPRNSYKNITYIRTARTNMQGIATVNFTIPWVYPYPQLRTFGKWMCFQSAQVKNPWLPGYDQRPNDTIWFEVGWIVELLTVDTTPDPVHKCELLNITITFKNIMMIDKYVVFTFAVLDDLLDPIGDTVAGPVLVPAGAWCHPYYDSLTVSIHIPIWAHNGPRCTVWVNAFTVLPSAGGCVYCPEISTSFTITYP